MNANQLSELMEKNKDGKVEFSDMLGVSVHTINSCPNEKRWFKPKKPKRLTPV